MEWENGSYLAINGDLGTSQITFQRKRSVNTSSSTISLELFIPVNWKRIARFIESNQAKYNASRVSHSTYYQAFVLLFTRSVPCCFFKGVLYELRVALTEEIIASYGINKN